MDVLIERCAGIDIGKNEVVACVRTPRASGRGRHKETRTFASFTGALEEMADWFTDQGVTEIAMEATGSYWKPVWYVLEELPWELKLVNAQHVKILAGRKSDVLDAEWLAELLEHGLLRGSFVPPPAIRELRDLTRYRKRLIQAHTSEGQRIAKTLEDAGIKLDSVASDVLGVSARTMLAALVAGERDPHVLAELAKGKAAQQDPGAAPGPARPVPRAPRRADRTRPGPHRSPGDRDRPPGRADRHGFRGLGQRGRRPFRPGP